MKQLIHEFYSEEKDPLTTFRTILLFGKNIDDIKYCEKTIISTINH
jgi:hypothetical protein